MTISLADACALVQSKAPAPVILVDTCNFLDLFRSDPAKPRVPYQEIRAAADLLDLLTARPDAVHLLVPELIPREYTDHANPIQTKCGVLGFGEVWQQLVLHPVSYQTEATGTSYFLFSGGKRKGCRRVYWQRTSPGALPYRWRAPGA